MLSNITMGQYYPTDSIVHRLDPRVKILLTIAFIVGIFLVHSLWGYALALVFVYFMARLSHVPFKMLMRGLRPLRFILVLTFVLNLFFSGEGTILCAVEFHHHYARGAFQGRALLPAAAFPGDRHIPADADHFPRFPLRRVGAAALPAEGHPFPGP